MVATKPATGRRRSAAAARVAASGLSASAFFGFVATIAHEQHSAATSKGPGAGAPSSPIPTSGSPSSAASPQLEAVESRPGPAPTTVVTVVVHRTVFVDEAGQTVPDPASAPSTAGAAAPTATAAQASVPTTRPKTKPPVTTRPKSAPATQAPAAAATPAPAGTPAPAPAPKPVVTQPPAPPPTAAPKPTPAPAPPAPACQGSKCG